MTANGVNHKTNCGEYTLLATITAAITINATEASVGVCFNSKRKTAIEVSPISNNKIDR